MENEMTISSIDNPELVNQLVAKAFSTPEESGEPVEKLEMQVLHPSDTEVKLLAGLYNPFTGEHADTAEIRELNGVDEEALSKIKDYGKGLLAILSRGTVKIGEQKATQEILDKLLSGDREYLIMKIRIATLGEELSLEGSCPFCNEEQTFEVNLNTDVEVTKLEDPANRSFTVKGKAGELTVEFPTGEVQKKLVDSTNKTSAELDSILLANSVIEINGLPIMDPAQVKTLGMQDRRAILKELTEKNPGPDLAGVKKACVSCGQEVPIPLTLADLFRL